MALLAGDALEEPGRLLLATREDAPPLEEEDVPPDDDDDDDEDDDDAPVPVHAPRKRRRESWNAVRMVDLGRRGAG